MKLNQLTPLAEPLWIVECDCDCEDPIEGSGLYKAVMAGVDDDGDIIPVVAFETFLAPIKKSNIAHIFYYKPDEEVWREVANKFFKRHKG